MPDIIYRTDDLLIVNKEAGLLSIPDRYDINKPNLKTILEMEFKEVYVVHRLDRETSGAICFALNRASHKALNEQFESRQVQKEYHLICYGKVKKDQFTVDRKISPDQMIKGKMKIDVTGKESVTEFEIIESFRNFTYLKAKPLTGRTHQIRIHIASEGYPIVCDSIYSAYKSVALSDFYNIGKENSRPLMIRQALHSANLEFSDPTSDSAISVTASLPRDMNILLKVLRKYNS